MRTVLVAAIALDDAALRRGPQGDSHFQRPDRQIAFHAVASGPADDAPEIPTEDEGEIQPSLTGPDIADVTCPFLVGPIRCEVTVQQVCRDLEPVVFVRHRFEFPRSFNEIPVRAHQPPDRAMPDPVMPDIDADFLQLFGHPWAAIAAQARPRLFLDVRQTTLCECCLRLGGRLRKARRPCGLTFTTRHSRG